MVKKKKKLPPRYCEACHRKVDYDYESNGYFCPEHGRLIFLGQGIPQSLIAGWWSETVIPIAVERRKNEMKAIIYKLEVKEMETKTIHKGEQRNYDSDR